MRVQLLHDRPVLENILNQPRREPVTLSDVEVLCTQYQQLSQFSYVMTMRATLSAEQKLQKGMQKAVEDLERKLSDSIPLLKQELQTASRPDELRVKRLYATIKRVTRDSVVDLFLEPRSDEDTLRSVARLRTELENCFSQNYNIGDERLTETLHRAYELTDALSRLHTDRASSIAAANLGRSIKHKAEQLRHGLVQHARDIVASTGRLASSKLEASQRATDYLDECAAVETYLSRIITAATIPVPLITPGTEQLIIGVRCDKKCDDLAKQLSRYGSVHRFNLIPYLTLVTDDNTARELLERPTTLAKNATVLKPRIYTVQPRRATYSGTDWNLDLINAQAAWHYTKGEGTKVAVIDTGVDYEHPDLEKRFGQEKGESFVGDSPLDDNGHGTHVAGTIAGIKTGVAPETQLYAVKVLDMSGSGSEVGVLQGMEWAIKKGVDAMNMSLGSSWPSEAEAELINIALERGIAVAAAAGNDGDGGYSYPASHPGAISVAAIDKHKQHAIFSNTNDRIAVCAPGVAVYSTWLGGGYETLSGTSMATPHVAGACALLRLRDDKTARDILRSTAEKMGDEEVYGAGLIDLAKAVKE